MLAEAGHRVSDAGVDGVGQLGHEREGLDVSGGDPACVCLQDALGERGVLGILDSCRARSGVKRLLTALAQSAARPPWVPGVPPGSPVAVMPPRPCGKAGTAPRPGVGRWPRTR
jgi:hypothetical protein